MITRHIIRKTYNKFSHSALEIWRWKLSWNRVNKIESGNFYISSSDDRNLSASFSFTSVLYIAELITYDLRGNYEITKNFQRYHRIQISYNDDSCRRFQEENIKRFFSHFGKFSNRFEAFLKTFWRRYLFTYDKTSKNKSLKHGNQHKALQLVPIITAFHLSPLSDFRCSLLWKGRKPRRKQKW